MDGAVKKPGLKEKHFFHPVLDTFMRALPRTYKDVPVVNMTVIKLVVTGEAGGVWHLVGNTNGWSLQQNVEQYSTALVTMDQETCWRLFTRGLSKAQASMNTTIEGDQKLGEKLLETISILA